ncbi:hypothetical protein [Streptomyces sp. FL07-04A]|uniref:hypothetical protein n=1 Tax=Streptomyces sp. FL07-04A TaxID=3028658 RepID=UPI0029B5EE05|nr:hypothetical protein [Streptomyces sp. FL07-04A]MDX3579218.1 hypothetical protein [Streptomyces sp. FL07-04A]
MKYTSDRLHRTLSRTAGWISTRIEEGRQERARRPDGGDISITTVIIWVAAVTGAVLIAGTIAIVVAKYNSKLSGL